MTTPTDPPGLLPPGSAPTPAQGSRATGTPPPWGSSPSAFGPPSSGKNDMSSTLPPAGAPEAHDRALVLSGAIVGALVVIVLALIFTALTGVLPFAHSSPAPIPTATPTPAERVLYSAPMTSGGSNSSTGASWPGDRSWPSSDQCSQSNDGYHITNNVVCFLTRYTPPPNVNISVDVKQVSGLTDPSYGIVFHRTGAGNFYSFEISGLGHWYFFKELNSTISQAGGGTASSAIHKGLNATNLLTVRISGTAYKFFVNGQLVGTGSDTSFTSGQAGLDGNEQIEVVYTNFKVSQTIGS